MNVGDLAFSAPIASIDVESAAEELVSGLMFRPWGWVSPSVYETGRLVTLAPWLIGHRERVRYLLSTQRSHGGWGLQEGYELVPTLSATDALLSVIVRGESAAGKVADKAADKDLLLRVAAAGLRRLLHLLHDDSDLMLPDMPAIELIVPSLIASINAHLDRIREMCSPEVAANLPSGWLTPPRGMNDAKLEIIRFRLESGAGVPAKLLHALEVAGDSAIGAAAVSPTLIGTVGASPAATAAWLGDRWMLDPSDPARRHLEAVATRYGGPVPVGFPITVFERGWVLSWLARAGVPVEVPPEMVADLRAAIGPEGTPAGPGLPADADTTSVALYALALLGAPCEPDSLRAFETETHFCTWQGEQGMSVSVNAHALDAFGQFVARRPDASDAYLATVRKLSAVLCEHQEPDGSWSDRWHASPFYATMCCALALDEFGTAEFGAAELRSPDAAPATPAVRAVRAAVRWVLDSQRQDGSWGRWGGTAEETAYALHILMMTRARSDSLCKEAAARGYRFLLRSTDPSGGPPLWHDKDLYRPVAIVQAAVLAALHLVRSDSVVVT